MRPLQFGGLFDEIADLYDRARPSYPEPLFDAIVSRTGLNSGSQLLEIGAGTGQATLPMAKRGYSILAVERGANLARLARGNLQQYPQVQVVTGKYEDIELTSEAFDLVYCATALHWIRPESRFRKTHQVLRRGGHFAILRGAHISDECGDLFFHASQPIYRKHFSTETDQSDYTIKKLSDVRVETFDAELFECVHFECFPATISFTSKEYCALLNTESPKLALPPETRSRFLEDIKQLIDTSFGGTISRCYANPLTILRKI
jgi:SAM-dependent methyltransferase